MTRSDHLIRITMWRGPAIWVVAALLCPSSLDKVFAQSEPTPALKVGGYLETYIQFNDNDPSNRITNARGFDARVGQFAISNVALETTYDRGDLFGAVTLQWGDTPDAYYLAEPSLGGSGTVPSSNADDWKFLQQAWLGARFGAQRKVELQAGLFTSPIGPEVIPIRDNWNWSRSNLFFALPFYHVGARVTVPLDQRFKWTIAAYNGWNSVNDGNDDLSLSTALAFTSSPQWSGQVLYFGGNERADKAPESSAWRHLFDGYVTWSPSARFSLLIHADSGFEENDIGGSSWQAAALAARVRLAERLWLALRADRFEEEIAEDGERRAGAIFFGVDDVTSGTVTLDWRPIDALSLRLEARHDRASQPLYFKDDVRAYGGGLPDQPNAKRQTTLTLGAVASF